MSAALASASARPSGGVASRSPNPRAPGRQTLPSSKTPCFETRKTRRTSNAPPSALPPTSVPKLKQQLARSRVTPPADEADASAGATGSNTSGPSPSAGSTVSSKKLSRWKNIARLMESEGASELYGASRINTYATSERYDLSTLASTLRSRAEMWHAPEALDDEPAPPRLRNPRSTSSDGGGSTDRGADDVKMAFFFEYGIVVFWGLTAEEERFATRDLLESCEIDPFAADDVEVDAMFFAHADPEDPNFSRERFERPSPSPSFRSSVDESADESALLESLEVRAADAVASTRRSGTSRAAVVDDVVAIPPAQAGDAAVMLAASHALAQSTKLALYERRAALLADATESIPRQMAETGETSLSAREATMLRGRVFLQRADLNVASAVLDSPAFLWQAPDRYARLYEETREYLEVETRAEVLNTRLNVLEDLVSAVVSNLETENGTRLELIVIWLIVIEVVIGLVEIWGIVGLGKDP